MGKIGDFYFCEECESKSGRLSKYSILWKIHSIEVNNEFNLKILQQDKNSFIAYKNYENGHSVFTFQEYIDTATLTKLYLRNTSEKQYYHYWTAKCKILLTEIYE